MLNTFRLTQHISEPTHELESTFDLFITNDDLDVPDLVITDVAISDHYLLTCSVNPSTAALTFITRTSCKWQCFEVDAFCLEVATGLGMQNACVWDNNSLDDLVDIFDDTIMSILDRLVPWRTKSFLVRPSNVWFDADCRAAKRLMKLKKRRYRSTGQSVIKQPGFYSFILIISSICDVKRSLFWKCPITSNSRNPKKLWNQINNVLGRTKRIAQSKRSADTFANFFQDKVKKIRQDTVNDAPPYYSVSSAEWITEFPTVTKKEVLTLLMSSPNKQSSLDSLPTWLFKKIGVDVALFLVALFNRSFEKGYVSSFFKKSIVTSLIKKEGLAADDLCSFFPVQFQMFRLCQRCWKDSCVNE